MQHNILGKIFHSASNCFLKISIDSNIVYSKEYESNKEHLINLDFFYEYKNNDIHELIFEFDSENEVPNKYIIIDSIAINCYNIPISNSFYQPKKTEWWQNQKNNIIKEQKVYKHGNFFGWFGKVYFYYYTDTMKLTSWQNALSIRDKIIFSNTKKD
jgi:hypothetical protein